MVDMHIVNTGDDYWTVIIDVVVCALTLNLHVNIVEVGILEHIEDITCKHAYLFDPVVVVATCIVLANREMTVR